ncbi:hypothetical protein EFR84_15295 [Rhizobium chutanense]|uniref:Uncharacterized protein n=1 Tax=Rhizobium chutanense TaxID=2035448 RepID=A0A3S0QZW6_9HYPH|nr:hypothetical protein EFR84_15295 [Rhizobium chutanense]
MISETAVYGCPIRADGLPLTLALSPRAGRGDVPCESEVETGSLRHGPFAPRAGVRRTGRDRWLDPGRWRQPDEGSLSPTS